MKTNNKGVTLIELIVTSLIMSLIVGIIVIFVASSRNSYTMIHNEAIMQNEAEIAMTYITNIAERATAYHVTDEFEVANGENTGKYKALIMKATDSSDVPYYYFIVHDKNAGKLRFCKNTCTGDEKLKWLSDEDKGNIGKINVPSTLREDNIFDETNNIRTFLADYVISFKPVYPDTDKGMIQIYIEFKYGKSSYSVGKNITSRNL